jgi:hypothetical protein
MSATSPVVVLYSKPGCGICTETLETLRALLAERSSTGLVAPPIEERDITTNPAWERDYFAEIPVVEIDRRLLASPRCSSGFSPKRSSRSRPDEPGCSSRSRAAARWRDRPHGLVGHRALVHRRGRGRPHQLPVAACCRSCRPISPSSRRSPSPGHRPPGRHAGLGNAAAYVAGFGAIFTLLGITATFAGGP